tara:strand:- start:375 stop:782 length:408 start_codon:yes stop_codon:yes gene_type:complete
MKILFKKIILFMALTLIINNCSLQFVKKRLSPPYEVEEGVLFQYDAPSARQVNLAGNFPDNEWLKHGDRVDLMNDDGENGDRIANDGVWSIIKSLSPGRYEYKFVIDRNTWVRDPNAFETIDDGYGGENSVLIVK